jgi:hypothetical protein
MANGTVIRIERLSFRMALHVPIETRKMQITCCGLVTRDLQKDELETTFIFSKAM